MKAIVVGLIFSAFLTQSTAHAEKFALLVGINRYAPMRGAANLEGPVNDVKKLQEVLVSLWHFKPHNIQTLLDADATRERILASLDALASSLEPDDFLFLFFSGHGTSSYAPGMPRSVMDLDTGAIVPSDLKLIIGDQDLQPRLRKLDAVAQVFAVFDSCYSGNSIKSIAIGQPKYTPPDVFKGVPGNALAQYDKQFADFNRFTAHPAGYPYRRLLYMSAASKAEQARDISSLQIASGFRTVDGLPHGALTNALLKGLRGEADTDHDGRITYQELHQFVRQAVTRQFTQTPQLLFPTDNPRSVASPVFSVSAPVGLSAATPAPETGKIRLKVESVDATLRGKLAALPEAVLSDRLFDLLVRGKRGQLELYHQSGSLIQEYAASEQDNLLRRIKAEPDLRRLTDLTYRQQGFNLNLRIMPDDRGFYSLGDRLSFSVEPEADSYLLFVNIDVSGWVTVIYPRSREQIVLMPAGTRSLLGSESEVTRPTGTEYLKLFAFREKPEGLESLLSDVDHSFSPGSEPFARLMRLVEKDGTGRAQTQLKLVTTE